MNECKNILTKQHLDIITLNKVLYHRGIDISLWCLDIFYFNHRLKLIYLLADLVSSECPIVNDYLAMNHPMLQL